MIESSLSSLLVAIEWLEVVVEVEGAGAQEPSQKCGVSREDRGLKVNNFILDINWLSWEVSCKRYYNTYKVYIIGQKSHRIWPPSRGCLKCQKSFARSKILSLVYLVIKY
jgi:hypothetical protein